MDISTLALNKPLSIRSFLHHQYNLEDDGVCYDYVIGMVLSCKYKRIYSHTGKLLHLIDIKLVDDTTPDASKPLTYQVWGQIAADKLKYWLYPGVTIIITGFRVSSSYTSPMQQQEQQVQPLIAKDGRVVYFSEASSSSLASDMAHLRDDYSALELFARIASFSRWSETSLLATAIRCAKQPAASVFSLADISRSSGETILFNLHIKVPAICILHMALNENGGKDLPFTDLMDCRGVLRFLPMPTSNIQNSSSSSFEAGNEARKLDLVYNLACDIADLVLYGKVCPLCGVLSTSTAHTDTQHQRKRTLSDKNYDEGMMDNIQAAASSLLHFLKGKEMRGSVAEQEQEQQQEEEKRSAASCVAVISASNVSVQYAYMDIIKILRTSPLSKITATMCSSSSSAHNCCSCSVSSISIRSDKHTTEEGSLYSHSAISSQQPLLPIRSSQPLAGRLRPSLTSASMDTLRRNSSEILIPWSDFQQLISDETRLVQSTGKQFLLVCSIHSLEFASGPVDCSRTQSSVSVGGETDRVRHSRRNLAKDILVVLKRNTNMNMSNESLKRNEQLGRRQITDYSRRKRSSGDVITDYAVTPCLTADKGVKHSSVTPSILAESRGSSSRAYSNLNTNPTNPTNRKNMVLYRQRSAVRLFEASQSQSWCAFRDTTAWPNDNNNNNDDNDEDDDNHNDNSIKKHVLLTSTRLTCKTTGGVKTPSNQSSSSITVSSPSADGTRSMQRERVNVGASCSSANLNTSTRNSGEELAIFYRSFPLKLCAPSLSEKQCVSLLNSKIDEILGFKYVNANHSPVDSRTDVSSSCPHSQETLADSGSNNDNDYYGSGDDDDDEARDGGAERRIAKVSDERNKAQVAREQEQEPVEEQEEDDKFIDRTQCSDDMAVITGIVHDQVIRSLLGNIPASLVAASLVTSADVCQPAAAEACETDSNINTTENIGSGSADDFDFAALVIARINSFSIKVTSPANHNSSNSYNSSNMNNNYVVLVQVDPMLDSNDMILAGTLLTIQNVLPVNK